MKKELKRINKQYQFLFKGEFKCDNPKTIHKIISKYPSTMSSNLFEHILTIINPFSSLRSLF